jgi:glycosyltransferase involved in cell wall biosynthesis
VEAAALLRNDRLSVKIAGRGEQEGQLRRRIEELGLAGRVELLGEVSDEELLEHYARCRAVYFAPANEDYGFVTLEAFRSGKAVITTHDSGGPAELVQHDQTGLVSDPTPQAVAGEIDRLAEVSFAERLGEAACAASQPHTWKRAVEFLTS